MNSHENIVLQGFRDRLADGETVEACLESADQMLSIFKTDLARKQIFHAQSVMNKYRAVMGVTAASSLRALIQKLRSGEADSFQQKRAAGLLELIEERIS